MDENRRRAGGLGRHIKALVIIAGLAPALTAQTTWYVDAAAAPGGDGSAAAPYRTIQEGVAAAAAADTVEVAPGTYLEAVDLLGKAISMNAAAGASATTIDAGGAGPAVRIAGPTDHGSQTALRGFTLTGGSGALGAGGVVAGGGLFLSGMSPLVEDCAVVGNTASGGRGGGVYAELSSASIVRCTIEDNVAGDSPVCGLFGSGGGVHVPTTVRLEDCTIRGNYAVQWGGGAYGGTLERCLIEDNLAANGGGLYGSTALSCDIRENLAATCAGDFAAGGGAESCVLTDCRLERNVADDTGGGAYTSTLVRCQVRDNRTVYATTVFQGTTGGGIADSTCTECTISGNRAAGLDDGMLPSMGGGASRSKLTRSLVYDNEADQGAGVWATGTHTVALDFTVVFDNRGDGVATASPFEFVRNCVVWANDGSEVLGPAKVEFSIVEGGHAGAGNVDVDPGFWAPFGGPGGAGRDFHPEPGSPCIDGGDPAAPADSDGSRADVGAHAYDPTWCPTPVVFCTAKTNSQGCMPAIDHSGTARLSASDLTVSASGVLNQKSGVLFWGRQSASVPFQGATRCVRVPVRRTQLQSSGGTLAGDDCTGTYAFTFDSNYLQSKGIAPGDEIVAQYWYLDPMDLGSGTGLTDAIWFVVCP